MPCKRKGCTDSVTDPECCSTKMLKMLTDVTNLLDKKGIAYHIVEGTLLGAVRDQSIIPWTADLDIMIDDDSLSILEQQTEIPYLFRRENTRG